MNDDAEQVRGVILLVEDSKLDVVLTRQCFSEVAPAVELHHVENGVEALAFLRREDKFADAPAPDLILLDLNMPMLGGADTCAEIVADENLKHLPVVVLTNSQYDEDIQRMYRMRANSYVRKPVDFERFVEVARCIVEYWFNVVTLPSEN